MQAAVYDSFGGPIRIETIPIPTCPSSGIVVQVKATGVCRSDWHGWKGHDDDVREHGLPFVPGHESSGVVVESRVDAALFRPGDRVVVPFILSCRACRYCAAGRATVCERQEQPGFTCLGSFAEYVAVPRAVGNVQKLPRQVSFVQAAALGCRMTTAYRAVIQQGNVATTATAGSATISSIAIFGCGGLGLSCILIAARVVNPETTKIVAIDISEAALNKARRLGATHTVLIPKHSNQGEDEEMVKQRVRQQVIEICNRQGADVSIDAAGLASTCEHAVYCTRRAGRMIQVGLPIGDHHHPPNIPMGRVAGWELELVGSHGFDGSTALPVLLDWIASGRLDPTVLVERCVSLAEGAQALQDMDHGSPLGVTMITRFDPPSTTNSKL